MAEPTAVADHDLIRVQLLSAAELSLLRGEGLETPSLFGDDSGDQP